MITVRFASGFSVQYNSANHVVRSSDSDYTDLYDQQGGNWIAQVPTGATIVERTPPCRTYHAIEEVARPAEHAAHNFAYYRTRLTKAIRAEIRSSLGEMEGRKHSTFVYQREQAVRDLIASVKRECAK